MLKIRLTQTGRKNAHKFRIVVKETRSKRDGRYIDQLGYYNPLVTPAEFSIDQEKLISWQQKGAQLTPAVVKLIEDNTKTKKSPKTN